MYSFKSQLISIDYGIDLTKFLEDSISEDFLYLLEIYDIIFIASDDRILLTPKGEKILQYIGQFVDLNKSSVKVLKK